MNCYKSDCSAAWPIEELPPQCDFERTIDAAESMHAIRRPSTM